MSSDFIIKDIHMKLIYHLFIESVSGLWFSTSTLDIKLLELQ